MASQIQFSPGIPLPRVFDVEERIQQLQSYLDPSDPMYQPEPQHVNIRAAIQLYKEGKIDGVNRVYIMDGKIATWEQMHGRTTWAWSEGVSHQYAQKHAYGNGPFGPHHHEFQGRIKIPHFEPEEHPAVW